MENNEITIRIKNTVISEGGDPVQPSVESREPQHASSPGITRTLGAMALKRGASYAVSNYGNLTGDYITQSQIATGVEIAGLIAVAATGPIGIAAATLMVGQKAADFYINRAKENKKIDYLRERTATWNGSR